jgi:predicted MFS family arabinose efflux permease
MMRRIPHEHGVTFSSVDQSLSNFGFIIAPNVGGILAVAIGVRSTLLIVAALGLAAFAMFALDTRRQGNAEGGAP